MVVQTHQYAKKCGFGITVCLYQARSEHGQWILNLSAHTLVPLISYVWLQLLVTQLQTLLLYAIINRSDAGHVLYFGLFIGIDWVIQCLSAWQRSAVVPTEGTEWKHWSWEVSFWTEQPAISKTICHKEQKSWNFPRPLQG